MTSVARLCVRVSGAPAGIDAQASASRTALAVRPLDLDSPSVPERAILCIRRLDDPLPGGIDIRSTHTRPTRWEHAARAAIGAMYRSAPRLLRDEVSTHANAVVFEDRAELLACAAQSLQSRAWWWTNVIATPLTIDAVAREWLRTPHYIPSAIALLDAPSLRTFLQALEVPMAARLTRRVLEVHGIPSVLRALDPPQAVVTALNVAMPATRVVVLQETSSGIAIECRALATLALALHASPVMTRRVLDGVLASSSPIATRAGAALQPTLAAIDGSPSITDPAPPAATTTTSPTPPERSRSDASSNAAQPVFEHTRPISIELHRATTPHVEPSVAPHEPPSVAPEVSPAATPQHPQSATAPEPTRPTLVTEPLHTPYAGLFFLLNAAIDLGYYDPYGRGKDIDLDVFEFLALCGTAWIETFEEDALFTFLTNTVPPDNRQPATDNQDERLAAIHAYVIDALPDIEDPETFLLARAGTIVVTPAHVDVHFTLETHPIEIRIAGLDRDPGWIPAAGRHVAFHFD